MSWWNPLDYFGLTTDGQSVNDLRTAEDDYQRRAAAEEQRRLDTGFWTSTQYDNGKAVRTQNATDVSGDVYGAAETGAIEGLQALPDTVRGGLNKTFTWSVSFVPWWGWLALIGAGVWYLGGFVALRGILAKK